jgi:hypothetical protein
MSALYAGLIDILVIVPWQPVALVDFLRLMPQKIPDYRAAYAVCRVKNRLKADFSGSYARSTTNC